MSRAFIFGFAVIAALLQPTTAVLQGSLNETEGSAPEWMNPYPSVQRYILNEDEEEPPIVISPCEPGEQRDPTTLGCMPRVSGGVPPDPGVNPCAASSCAPGVGLEGAQDLINPGILQDQLDSTLE